MTSKSTTDFFRVGCQGLQEILITHWHHDHLGGVPALVTRFGGVPVRKYMPAGGAEPPSGKGEGAIGPHGIWPAEKCTPLEDGEVVRAEGASLRVLCAPGHADHRVSLLLEEEGSLFTGDNVLGAGTAVLHDLGEYLASLERRRSHAPDVLSPGHGPHVAAGGTRTLGEDIGHRRKRVDEVRDLVQSAGRSLTLDQITRLVYKDLAEHLMRPAASNARHVLAKLEADGDLAKSEDGYMAAKL